MKNKKIKNQLKKYILNHRGIARFFRKNLFAMNGTKILNNNKTNKIQLRCHLKNSKIEIDGERNNVFIDENSSLSNCLIKITGNDNVISIGTGDSFNDCTIIVIDNYGRIIIGNNGSCVKTEFVTLEGKMISIGDDFMFANEIHIRTGDSHSLISYTDRERLNFQRTLLSEIRCGLQPVA